MILKTKDNLIENVISGYTILSTGKYSWFLACCYFNDIHEIVVQYLSNFSTVFDYFIITIQNILLTPLSAFVGEERLDSRPELLVIEAIIFS